MAAAMLTIAEHAGRLLHEVTASETVMARWPRNVRTTIFTYGTVFVLFPVLCWLAWAYVQGWLF